MNIQSLNHSGLLVADLEKSRWFYGTVLGMEEVPRPKNFKFEGAWFRGGTCEIHLLLAQTMATPIGFGETPIEERPAYATHLAFEVQDFEMIVAAFDEHDITPSFGPIGRGDGMRQVFVHDPDRYLLEFYSWMEGSEVDVPERTVVNFGGENQRIEAY